METIFENYEIFLKEHQDDLSNPSDVIRLLNDDGMFRAYIDSLTEGLEPEVSSRVQSILNRQRAMVIQESANVPASSFASGWTVMDK